MSAYSIKKQVKIVTTTIALHNYIHHHPSYHDIESNVVDKNQSYVLLKVFEYRIGHSMIKTNQDSIN